MSANTNNNFLTGHNTFYFNQHIEHVITINVIYIRCKQQTFNYMI